MFDISTFITYVATMVILSVGSPTLPHNKGELWQLNPSYPIVVSFVDQTCADFDVSEMAVIRVVSEEYAHQLYTHKHKSKKDRVEAVRITLSWCRYWRDQCPRISLDIEALSEYSKTECFFRAMQKRE